MPLHRLTSTALAGLLSLVMLLLAAPSLAQEAGADSDPAYGTLADLIEDDASRNALIEELRALQAARASVDEEGTVPAEQIAAESPSDQQPEEVSFARRMAATTGNLAANMGEQFAALGAAVGGLVGAGQAQADDAVASEVNLQEVGAAAVNLAILVIATFVVFLVLRAIASPAFRSFSAWAQRGSEKFAMLRTIVAVAVAALVDVIVVALAYVAGGFVSSLLVNEVNADATRLALFLNAFLVVELVKAALRMMFSSGYEGLRLIPVGAGQARYANRFLANLTGFIGYGMLVLVPILNFHMSPVLGTAVGTLVMLLALLYAVAVILKKRTVIRDRLLDKAEATTGPGRLALGVQHGHIEPGDRQRRRAGLGRHRLQTLQIGNDRPAGLGLPPVIDDRHRQQVLQPMEGRRIEPFAGQEQRPQARNVMPLQPPAIGIFLLDRAKGGRRGKEGPRSVLLDQAPESPGIGGPYRLALVDQRGAAVDQRSVDDVGVADDPADVRGREEHLAGRHAIDALHRVVQRHRMPAIIAHHALGLAGGSRGVQDVQRIAGIDGDAIDG